MTYRFLRRYFALAAIFVCLVFQTVAQEFAAESGRSTHHVASLQARRSRLSPPEQRGGTLYERGQSTDPGVTDTEINVASILPLKGPLAETSAAVRDVLLAYFDDVNIRGGIYNRKIALRVAETGDTPATKTAGMKRMVAEGNVFAFVGGISAGADTELDAIVRAEKVPTIGPSTLLPQANNQSNRYLFYLLPSVREQARALVNFAITRPGLKSPPAGLVTVANNELSSAAMVATDEQAKRHGLPPLSRESYATGQFKASDIVARLKRENVESLFFFGNSGDDIALLKEADANDWRPQIFLLGVFSSRDLVASVPAMFQQKVFLSFPTIPADVTPESLSEYRALQQKYKLAPTHVAAQLNALAAGKVFVEALKRAGRDLTRERLITVLEGLSDFQTGFTPRITFAPNRRVGAAGAYIVTVNTEKREFSLVGGWVVGY